ncbi:hypothetical protein Dimus_034495 [Dionaea muscipula]
MGKAAETTKKRKKKKGRPSLLELQKRALQKSPNDHHHHHHFKNSKNPNTKHHLNRSPPPIPLRRSNRRNPNPGSSSPPPSGSGDDGESEDEVDGSDEDDERREKKVKMVGRLPSDLIPESSVNSHTPFNALLTYNPNGGGFGGADPETFSTQKRRRINAATADEHDYVQGQKGLWKATGCGDGTGAGSAMESGPTTALPDKMSLLLILEKLQKKDTRGAFAEPVDPEELPDYHEVIENPMDFGTIRKNLDEGIYCSLEQLEADVFLICANAMEYNASHTIYFRQARSIKELAKVEFENLRQCGGNIEQQPKANIEQQPKPNIEQPLKPRRGRPPGSISKRKSLESSPADHVSPAFSSAATLAPPAGDDGLRSSHYNLRKGPSLLKLHSAADGLSRASYASRHVENHITFPDSAQRASYMKCNRIQLEFEDSRRRTYIQPGDFSMTDNLSALSSVGLQRQPLLPVGVHSDPDHGYARSLARFAANLGPRVWKIASRKIRSALPPGVEFGPGWVDEAVPPNQKLHSSSQCNPPPQSAYPSAKSSIMASEGDIIVDARRLNARPELTLLNGIVQRPGPGLQSPPPYWAQDSAVSLIRPGMNGVGGGYGHGLASPEEVRPGPSSVNPSFVQQQQQQGSFGNACPRMIPAGRSMASARPPCLEASSCSEVVVVVTPPPAGGREAGPLPMDYWAGMDVIVGAVEPGGGGYQGRPFWPEVSAQEKWVSSSILPDMNTAGFQASSSQMLEMASSPQLDLMLQL